MKLLLKIFLLLLPFAGFSQSKAAGNFKISKTKLLEAKLITDLVKDVPADCKVTGYKFSIKTNDKNYKLDCVGNELRIDLENAFKKANVGDKFVFDKLETACLDKHKKKYNFTITE